MRERSFPIFSYSLVMLYPAVMVTTIAAMVLITVAEVIAITKKAY